MLRCSGRWIVAFLICCHVAHKSILASGLYYMLVTPCDCNYCLSMNMKRLWVYLSLSLLRMVCLSCTNFILRETINLTGAMSALYMRAGILYVMSTGISSGNLTISWKILENSLFYSFPIFLFNHALYNIIIGKADVNIILLKTVNILCDWW
jgi:hypothetical protein